VERALLAAVLTAMVVGLATLLRRGQARGVGATPGDHGWELPRAVRTSDLQAARVRGPKTGARWWLVAFTSAACESCARATRQVESLAGAGDEGAGGDVAVAVIDDDNHRDLHERYGIDAVPVVAVCDHTGEVARWLLGRFSDGALAGALAGARTAAPDPGSTVQIRPPAAPS
jgi:hypothetical protein